MVSLLISTKVAGVVVSSYFIVNAKWIFVFVLTKAFEHGDSIPLLCDRSRLIECMSSIVGFKAISVAYNDSAYAAFELLLCIVRL